MIIGNKDRVFLQQVYPFANSRKAYIINFISCFIILGLSLIRILNVEGFIDEQTIELEDKKLIIPLDLNCFNLFIAIHLANTEYIGTTNLDFWQYVFMRVMPFLSIFMSTFITDFSNYIHYTTIDYLLVTLVLYHICYFAFYDYSRST